MDAEGNYFELEDPEGSVSFNLPGCISLITDNYHQLFKNTRNLVYTQLPGYYSSPDKLYKDAECYTEGITNKQKFLKQIHDPGFCQKHGLTTENKKFLSELIAKSKHAPPTIIKQLFMNGYGRIADLLEFSDPRPELIITCELFWEFIKSIRAVSL